MYIIAIPAAGSICTGSNLSGAFAFVSSWWLGMEEVSASKILGIVACFAGAVCVGMSDASDDSAGRGGANTTVTGDLIALGAALGYGLYTTVLKYKVRPSSSLHAVLVIRRSVLCATYVVAYSPRRCHSRCQTMTASRCTCYWGILAS
jgi:drug/metabolite transporter (DMT)-like permease